MQRAAAPLFMDVVTTPCNCNLESDIGLIAQSVLSELRESYTYVIQCFSVELATS